MPSGGSELLVRDTITRERSAQSFSGNIRFFGPFDLLFMGKKCFTIRNLSGPTVDASAMSIYATPYNPFDPTIDPRQNGFNITPWELVGDFGISLPVTQARSRQFNDSRRGWIVFNELPIAATLALWLHAGSL